MDKKINAAVDGLLKSATFDLDSDGLKKLTSLLKHAENTDVLVEMAIDRAVSQMEKHKHAQLRFHGFCIVLELVKRSRHARNLVSTLGNHILDICVGPKSCSQPHRYADVLRDKVLRVIPEWDAAYSQSFPQFSILKKRLELQIAEKTEHDRAVAAGKRARFERLVEIAKDVRDRCLDVSGQLSRSLQIIVPRTDSLLETMGKHFRAATDGSREGSANGGEDDDSDDGRDESSDDNGIPVIIAGPTTIDVAEMLDELDEASKTDLEDVRRNALELYHELFDVVRPRVQRIIKEATVSNGDDTFIKEFIHLQEQLDQFRLKCHAVGIDALEAEKMGIGKRAHQTASLAESAKQNDVAEDSKQGNVEDGEEDIQWEDEQRPSDGFSRLASASNAPPLGQNTPASSLSSTLSDRVLPDNIPVVHFLSDPVPLNPIPDVGHRFLGRRREDIEFDDPAPSSRSGFAVKYYVPTKPDIPPCPVCGRQDLNGCIFHSEAAKSRRGSSKDDAPSAKRRRSHGPLEPVRTESVTDYYARLARRNLKQ
eukprot:ANDGO_03525.mRNA.1 hypothetical protein